MYLNMILMSFGLNPDEFVDEPVNPLTADDGSLIYNIRQKVSKENRICPDCKIANAVVNDYNFVDIRFTKSIGKVEIVRIKKLRCKCKQCKKTFTIPVTGVREGAQISDDVINTMKNDFTTYLSFTEIADQRHVSSRWVMDMFDKCYPAVPRLTLTEAICMDEISFKTKNGSYAAVIYDHHYGEIIDVIENRQKAYLEEYFDGFNKKELEIVKYFITDMYQAYADIQEKYFPEAIHIIDMFHVVQLLRNELSRYRIMTMKQFAIDNESLEHSFMKSHWKIFEKKKSKTLFNKTYKPKNEDYELNVWCMMQKCFAINPKFWDMWSIYQEFLEWKNYSDYEGALKFVERIKGKLEMMMDERTEAIAKTLHKWRVEIANAMSLKTNDKGRYSNSIAECINNKLKTIVKDANGYRNFIRFRKRVLLICSYGKNRKQVNRSPKKKKNK